MWEMWCMQRALRPRIATYEAKIGEGKTIAILLAILLAAALRMNLNIDGAPLASRSHTHPSHSQTSRLLTSSLSLGARGATRPPKTTLGALCPQAAEVVANRKRIRLEGRRGQRARKRQARPSSPLPVRARRHRGRPRGP
jgi:hypothetical protein